ncbi:hypothetical protein [Anatilimnocola floriformis]|uniref:hypothetical protein n=1 Tax=Anatilimnocola floriformis TaxID=2948575 RepID=UPI0020C547CB|nr:hypothetical protein [Anatilimnocola floriformis]
MKKSYYRLFATLFFCISAMHSGCSCTSTNSPSPSQPSALSKEELKNQALVVGTLEQFRSRTAGVLLTAVDAVLTSPPKTDWKELVGSIDGAKKLTELPKHDMVTVTFVLLAEIRDIRAESNDRYSSSQLEKLFDDLLVLRTFQIGNDVAADEKDAKREVERLLYREFRDVDFEIREEYAWSSSVRKIELKLRMICYLAEVSGASKELLKTLVTDGYRDCQSKGLSPEFGLDATISALIFRATK